MCPSNPAQLPLGVEPPRVPRAINSARPAMPEGDWRMPTWRLLMAMANGGYTGREALVAFLDGWRPCTIAHVHEGSLDWPEKRAVVVLQNGSELEINDLRALAIPKPPRKKKP